LHPVAIGKQTIQHRIVIIEQVLAIIRRTFNVRISCNVDAKIVGVLVIQNSLCVQFRKVKRTFISEDTFAIVYQIN
jgi:hypothetical protein